MDIIAMARELGKAIPWDKRYQKESTLAKKANDEDRSSAGSDRKIQHETF